MSMKGKDIARMIGVSPATVSLVLNNRPGVSDKKRAEIIRKIKELNCGYMLKDELIDNGNIGFVVYKREGSIVDESPFFNYLLEGITDTVRKYGYNLNFIYVNKQMPLEEQKRQMESVKCKGVIIYAVEMFYDDLNIFKQTGIPFVILDNSFRENDVDAVAINNVQGTNKALLHLFNMGHKRIGYIKSKVVINSFIERYAAFEQALNEKGFVFDNNDLIEVGYSEREVKHDTLAYIEKNNNFPTAFFAENDLIGCNAVLAFKEAGIGVPDDISVIGFDDRPICTMIEPQLTTIEVPKHILGPQAVELLISKMDYGRDYSVKVEVGTKLVIRKSVKDLTRE
ncbi:MAG: LacI family DNA-binding transcriptional regulator [Lachnospiraceae bacterium]